MSPQALEPLPEQWTEHGFRHKLQRYALAAGGHVVEKALWLYFAARRPDCPAWAKVTVYGTLGYFISMVDAIPDVTPVLGYTDDLALMTLAVATLASYVDDAVKQRAADVMARYFPAPGARS